MTLLRRTKPMRALLVAISLLCPAFCFGQDSVSSDPAYQLLQRRLIEYDLLGQSIRGPLEDSEVKLLTAGRPAHSKASLLSSSPGSSAPAGSAPVAFTIVNVLNSSCSPCLVEMPELLKLARDTKTSLFLWYDLEEKGPGVDQFRQDIDPANDLPSLYDPKKKLHEQLKKNTAYPNEQTPKTLLVDSQGVVRFALTGSLLGRQELLKRAIERLQRLPAAGNETPKPPPLVVPDVLTPDCSKCPPTGCPKCDLPKAQCPPLLPAGQTLPTDVLARLQLRLLGYCGDDKDCSDGVKQYQSQVMALPSDPKKGYGNLGTVTQGSLCKLFDRRNTWLARIPCFDPGLLCPDPPKKIIKPKRTGK